MPAVVIGERLLDERRRARSTPAQVEAGSGIGRQGIRRSLESRHDRMSGGICEVHAGCDGDSSPQSPTPPPQAEERITGSERLGWDQQAASIDELASFRYAIYVDDVRSELSGVTCADTAGPQGFACSARLPTLQPGSHTLQLATFLIDDGALESSRSTALQVVVGPAAVLSGAERWRAGLLVTTADKVRLRLELVADHLDEPTDLGFAPDGRVFVAEKPGRISIVQDARPQTAAALEPGDVVATGDGGLLALAVDPQFQRTGFVYVIYTARAPGGSVVFRLARLREVAGTFGERALLLDDVPALPERAAASLRFGVDEKLYAVLDGGGSPSRGADLSSYQGKVLRLNPDGTTPTDQMGGSPLFAYAIRSPRGMDWQPATGTLWIADGVTDESEHLDVVRDGDAPVTRRIVEAVLATRLVDSFHSDPKLLPAVYFVFLIVIAFIKFSSRLSSTFPSGNLFDCSM